MRISRGLSHLALLLCFLPFAHAEKVSTLPKPTGYIDDYASAFSSSAKSQMESLCKEVHEKTKAQIFVVTVNTLDNASVEEFSNDLFHTWKIGEKKTDRGILILFAIKDHKYRIEVGYGLEGILNDAKVGDIGRTMLPDLRANDYDGAATLSLNAISQVIADDAHITLDTLTKAPETPPEPAPLETAPPQDNGKKYFFFLFFGIWGVVIAIIAIAFLVSRRKGFKGSSVGTAFTSRDDDSNSSSSDSSSSSSDSFSGGDGGDSGGGGASGSW